jgi:hypothetical protein
MNTTLAAEFGRKGSVRVLLGPLEKVGSDPETAEELSWAVVLSVAARRGSHPYVISRFCRGVGILAFLRLTEM